MFTALGFGLLVNVVLPVMAIAGVTLTGFGVLGIVYDL